MCVISILWAIMGTNDGEVKFLNIVSIIPKCGIVNSLNLYFKVGSH